MNHKIEKVQYINYMRVLTNFLLRYLVIYISNFLIIIDELHVSVYENACVLQFKCFKRILTCKFTTRSDTSS